MEDIEPTEAEREQMRRFNAFRRVSTGILAKWAWPLALAFCLLAAAFSAAIVRRSAASPARYGAATRLLFSPRQAPNVPPMGDRQLLGVLDRASLKRAAGERLADLSDASRARLDGDLSIEQERKPTNLFTLSADAPTPEEAVAKVNAYAAVLIDEYAAYRSRDLDAWAATLEERAGDLTERIAALDAEEAVAKGGAGTVSPAETLALLNGLVSDQRRNLSRLGFELSDEEARRKRLEESAGDRASVVAACAPKIRRASAELAALDAELAKLREKYTDENPLVKGKAADREALLGSFLAMLRENGLDGVGPADVERIEKAAAGLADAAARVEALEASRRSLEREIEENEARIARITAAIPVLERIRVDRDELSRGLRDLEEQRRDIRYLSATAAGDLRQIEAAGGASERSPLRLSNFAAAAAAAALCAFVLAVWILALELAFGTVRDAAELGAAEDVRVLGALPAPGVGEAAERDAARSAALAFCRAEESRGVVLVQALSGAAVPEAFSEALDWSLAMSGRRRFRLELVPGAGFAPPEGSETMTGVVRKGDRGWFPLSGLLALDQTEVRMLEADLAALRGSFDDVFVEAPAGLRGGPFLEQALGLAGSVLFVVAAGATPRRELRRARAVAARAGRPAAGIAVERASGAAGAKSED